ncbi:MAG: M20 metallopeptidase family protein [Chitinophagaceae bacterium]|jgi:amidohydrolase
MIEERIRQLASAYAADTIAIRHHLHAHPELSFQEFNTSEFVQQKLTEIGIPFSVMATTGVVGIITGKDPESRVIALRADIDALPIFEGNDVPYKSTCAGVMHACGHDVHTSCLLGAARILQETKNEWSGTIKLIFQPGEEKNPGGASLLIKEGVLQNPIPSCIVGLHVNPHLETGKLSFRAGQVMASADEIYITIKSKGGHAASPHKTTDTILVAAHLIVSLQQIVSRNCDPFAQSVLSICAINGGHTTNVIPHEVKLMGTFRAMDEKWRFKAHDLIKRHADGIALAMDAEIDLHIDIGYPSVYNDASVNDKVISITRSFFGNENVEETELRMGAEDFGYYTREIPGCFFRLGTGNIEKGITSGVHTPTFDIDERAIEIGMASMAVIGAKLRYID